jgi:hypothetical protein
MMTMKKNTLTELDSDELAAKKKTLKGVMIGLGAVLLISFMLLLYLDIKDQNYVVIPVIFASLITLTLCLLKRNQIDKEIKSRESEYVK